MHSKAQPVHVHPSLSSLGGYVAAPSCGVPFCAVSRAVRHALPPLPAGGLRPPQSSLALLARSATPARLPRDAPAPRGHAGLAWCGRPSAGGRTRRPHSARAGAPASAASLWVPPFLLSPLCSLALGSPLRLTPASGGGGGCRSPHPPWRQLRRAGIPAIEGGCGGCGVWGGVLWRWRCPRTTDLYRLLGQGGGEVCCRRPGKGAAWAGVGTGRFWGGDSVVRGVPAPTIELPTLARGCSHSVRAPSRPRCPFLAVCV